MRRTMLTLPVAGLLAASALAACGSDTSSSDSSSTGCGDAASDGGGLDVVAAFYPLAFAAEQVGGDNVNVSNLTPAGQEPHDLELAPSDIAAIEASDCVIYLEGFIPELDQAVSEYASGKALEVSSAVELLGYDETEAFEDEHAEEEEGHSEDEHAEEHVEEEEGHSEDEHAEEDHSEEPTEDHSDEATEDEHAEEEEGHDDHEHEGLEGSDPHIWLDPVRYAAIGDAIADALAGIDEDNADAYATGAEDFTAALNELDSEFAAGLADRTSDDIVTSHAAFGYLADRYDLHQVAISGLSPDQEASSQRMAEIAEFVEEHGVTTIFFETLVSSSIADTIADETGAQTEVLNPLEGLTEADGPDADYFSVMRDNLAALRSALGSA